MSGTKPRAPSKPRVFLVKRKLNVGRYRYSYQLNWFDRKGRRYRESVGEDKDHAEDMLEKKREELKRGITGACETITLDVFIEKIDSIMILATQDTRQKTRRSLELLKEYAAPPFLQDIAEASVIQMKEGMAASKKFSLATINRTVREIRSALTYARRKNYIPYNPLLGCDRLCSKEPEKTIRTVEQSEFVKLLEHCRTFPFRALLVCAYRQGMRRSELANLRWIDDKGQSNVDFERSRLRIINLPGQGELTKSRKIRTCPMHPETLKVLRRLWDEAPKAVMDGESVPRCPHVFTDAEGRKFRPDRLSREFEYVIRQSGVKKCTLHDLRRSFSTIAQRAGVDKYTVKDLGGWSDVSVIEKHYTGEIGVVLQNAMDKIVLASSAQAG